MISNDAREIEVLDHGLVRLVAHMGNDLSIVRNARVSHDAAWREGFDEGSDRRLLDYLIRNQHTSPLEAVEFQFEIKCPIFVARQWHRHRTWSYNEVSARYSKLPEEFYLPKAEHIQGQAKGNKQQRSGAPIGAAPSVRITMEEHFHRAYLVYENLIHAGVARELARSVLPLAQYTHFFAKVDLKNLLHFISLRQSDHAQYEIRVYADAMLSLIRPFVPVTIELWEREQRRQMNLEQLMKAAVERAERLEKELIAIRMSEGPNQVVFPDAEMRVIRVGEK